MRRRFGRVRRSHGSGSDAVFVELEDDATHVLSAAPWSGGTRTGERADAAERLAPVAPSKILCVGRNYHAHAKEMGNEVPKEPMIFYKPITALLDPGGAVELPPEEVSSRVEHEAEIALVIGRRLRKASETDAAAGIFGVTIACDVTARDLQKTDGQWWRAKGMDTFCPVGPIIVTELDPHELTIECRVNGARRQLGHGRDMIFPLSRVLSHISRSVTLEPGDLVLTGSPEGVGPLRHLDQVTIEIAEIGALEFTVRGAESAAQS